MAPFEREGQLTQPRVGPGASFPVWGQGCWVCENVCWACPPATLARSLPAPRSVISSQLAGPDAPDTVNEMLKFMAG